MPARSSPICKPCTNVHFQAETAIRLGVRRCRIRATSGDGMVRLLLCLSLEASAPISQSAQPFRASFPSIHISTREQARSTTTKESRRLVRGITCPLRILFPPIVGLFTRQVRQPFPIRFNLNSPSMMPIWEVPACACLVSWTITEPTSSSSVRN